MDGNKKENLDVEEKTENNTENDTEENAEEKNDETINTEDGTTEPEEPEKKSRKKLKIFLLVLGIALILIGAAMTGVYFYQIRQAEPAETVPDETTFIETTVPEQTDSPDKPERPVNPIDFSSLIEKNDEIYAWIRIPGTKVDYPVCQSKTDDEFYLNHRAEDRAYFLPGAIYSEQHNSTDFGNRVTVLYGHHGYGDSMFTTLHYFDNDKFFAEHKEFYVYTPKKKITYKVVSAFRYDNRHILNSYKFSNDEEFEDFLNTIQNPNDAGGRVNDLGRKLTVKDKIIVLSTCVWNQDNVRYLVCGVEDKVEETS